MAQDRKKQAMKPLKIATVIPAYGLLGGAEGFVFELTERIASRTDFEVHVFANKWRPGSAPVEFHKVPIIKFPRWAAPVSFARSANRQIEMGGFDLIHSHERIFAMDIFSFHGIPHLTWRRDVRKKAPGLFDLALGWVEKKGITDSRLKKIMPVSSLAAAELTDRYPSINSKVQVNHPGVALELFDKYDRDQCRTEIRARHGLDPDDMVGLFVGMNFEVKGLDYVLDGYARIKQQSSETEAHGRKLKLLVVGRDDERQYKALAQKADIDQQVIFAGATSEVVPYYLASDFFMMPSRYDTFGLVVLEAMAAGLPVIISENVGARDVVDHGSHGFILPPAPSPGDMAAAIIDITDQKMLKNASRQCRARAEQYSWDKLADTLAGIYHELLTGK